MAYQPLAVGMKKHNWKFKPEVDEQSSFDLKITAQILQSIFLIKDNECIFLLLCENNNFN